MNVWVVGGAGYIGSHVCKALRQAGHAPMVFDDLSTGRRENLPPDVIFRKGSILEPDALRKAFSEFPGDAVIHLAALKAAGESMRSPEVYARHNIAGSINLLEAMLEARLPRIVFSSSAAVYGPPERLPLDEAHPTRPENFYGHTKLVIEELLAWYGRLKGIGHVSLRYFNAAGYDPEGGITGLEKNPANLIPVVMEAALGWRDGVEVFGDDYETDDGTCIRDYVHVTDLATAHVAALEHLERGRESMILNLGTGSGSSVLEIVRRAAEVSGRPVPFEIAARRAGDPAVVVASAALASEVLGWSPRHSDIDTILRTTWNVYASAGRS